jgi:hypothetical protein
MVTFCPSVLHRYCIPSFSVFLLILSVFSFLFISFTWFFITSQVLGRIYSSFASVYCMFLSKPCLFFLLCARARLFKLSVLLFYLFLNFCSSTDRLVQSFCFLCFLVISFYIFHVISLPVVFLCNFFFLGLFLIIFLSIRTPLIFGVCVFLAPEVSRTQYMKMI